MPKQPDAAPAEAKPAPNIEHLDDGRIAIDGISGEPDDHYVASNVRAARAWLRAHGYDAEMVPGSDERPVPDDGTTPPTIGAQPTDGVSGVAASMTPFGTAPGDVAGQQP